MWNKVIRLNIREQLWRISVIVLLFIDLFLSLDFSALIITRIVFILFGDHQVLDGLD